MRNLSRNSDEVLLKLVAGDDEAAFEELFNRYWEKAHALACAKLQSRELAQELVHDLFLNFWQRRHSLNIENFSHYLQVSVKYKVITHITQQVSRRKHFEDFVPETSTAREEALMSLEYNDLVHALDEQVKNLPEKTQEVFRLNRLEGRSVSEIARRLNVSEKAIEYHITRSRKELRLLLKDFLTVLAIGCWLA